MKLLRRIIWVWAVWLLLSPFMLDYAINQGWTNSKSEVSTMTWYLDDSVWEDKAFKFIADWIYHRKQFIDEIRFYSEKLEIDPNLVIACVLGEQVRIAVQGRAKLKQALMWTPMLLRSSQVSLWLWWIKVNTSKKIARDAIFNWYGYHMQNDIYMKDYEIREALINDDKFNAKYSTYLVKNILVRRENDWYDISNNPWVVGTLYNMWNNVKKIPHKDPQIWGTVMVISWKQYTYWDVVAWMFYHLSN